MEFQIDKKTLFLVLGLLLFAVVAFLAYKIINTSSHKTLGMVTVEMKTSKGIIGLELDGEKSPVTVENFLKYVNDGYYDGLIFHRVIDGFMIQGGGFEPGMKEKDTIYPQIKNEARESWLENKRGTIAMARTNDPDSATSQFFINLADNDFLNPGGNDFYGYAVFGKVVSGIDVVDAIAKVLAHSVGMFDDVPAQDIVIESVRVKK